MKNFINQFIDTQFDHLDSMMIVCGVIMFSSFCGLGFFGYSPWWSILTAFSGTILLTGTRFVMAFGQWRHCKRLYRNQKHLPAGYQPRGDGRAGEPPGAE